MMKLEQCEGFDQDTLSSLTGAAESLNEFQGKLDGTVGGIINWFNGKQEDLGTFGTSIGQFADGMLKLKNCEALDSTVLDSIISAAGSLQELQGKLDGTVGGIVNWFNGKQEDLGTFGTSIGQFADGMLKLKNCEALNSETLASIITKIPRNTRQNCWRSHILVCRKTRRPWYFWHKCWLIRRRYVKA